MPSVFSRVIMVAPTILMLGFFYIMLASFVLNQLTTILRSLKSSQNEILKNIYYNF